MRESPTHNRSGAGAVNSRLAIPVGLEVLLMGRPDHLQQPLVRELARGTLTGHSMLKSRRRHAQHPANRLDTEAIAMPVNEHAHFRRSVSSSVAKNTLAALRISVARRSS
jgi:hypothetical protein